MVSRRFIQIVVPVVALALPIGLLLTSGGAQIKKGKTRPATTKSLMGAAFGPSMGAFAMALKDAGPADDAAWSKLANQASLLNELGYSLMEDGRCPDGVWAEATKTLREGTAKLMEAAAAKNLADAKAAAGGLGAACASCHGAHKK